MAVKAWKDLVSEVNHAGAALWHLRNKVIESGSTFPGRLTLVASYPGSGGSWDTQGQVGNGAYIVVESGRAWPAGGKWQVLIGCRTTTSGPIAGYTEVLGPTMWVRYSLTGGWNTGTETFGTGAVVTSWLPCSAMNPWNTASVVTVAVMDVQIGVAQNTGLLLYGRVPTECLIGLYVGGYRTFVSAVGRPGVVFGGRPMWIGVGPYWGAPDGGFGRVPNPSETGFFGAFIENTNASNWQDSRLLTLHTGEPAGFPFLVYGYDGTAVRVAGWLPEIYRTDASVADWTMNAAGTRCIVGGVMFPAGDIG